MKRKDLCGVLLRAAWRYLLFFLLVAFVTTCCMVLFLSQLTKSVDITFTPENMNAAAKLTFANVLLLSFLFALIDAVRRKLTVQRPVKRITDTVEKFMHGDFSVRIPHTAAVGAEDPFEAIIDRFNRLADELSGLETLRTDFIADVSHEMKTPLAVIQNYGTLLQDADLSGEQRAEYAKGITDASHRMADMITNILKLNRLENQQIYPQPTVFDLGEHLCECLLRYESVWEAADIDLSVNLAEGIAVQSDRELLGLVWNNLFSNAFKFTPHGGRVSVSLEADEHLATVQVADTGCGMSAEVGQHIFEKFYQGDPSRAVQGNGLGLALVKRVTDILKGEIAVESTVGRGTVFTVKIRRNDYAV